MTWQPIYTIFLAAALGIISRTLLPFLLTVKDAPDTKFDRKFLLPVLMGVFANLLLAPAVFQSLSAEAGWIVAYLAGYGTTDLSRDLTKLVGANIDRLKWLK